MYISANHTLIWAGEGGWEVDGGVLEHVCKWNSSRKNSSLQVIQWTRVRPHTTSRGSHVSNVRLCSRVSWYFFKSFFSFSKSEITFSPSVSDQASVSLECNLGEEKREDRGEKQSITIILSKKCTTINLNDWSIYTAVKRQAGRQIFQYTIMHKCIDVPARVKVKDWTAIQKTGKLFERQPVSWWKHYERRPIMLFHFFHFLQFFIFKGSCAVKKILKVREKKSRFTPTEAPFSHRKHCT